MESLILIALILTLIFILNFTYQKGRQTGYQEGHTNAVQTKNLEIKNLQKSLNNELETLDKAKKLAENYLTKVQEKAQKREKDLEIQLQAIEKNRFQLKSELDAMGEKFEIINKFNNLTTGRKWLAKMIAEKAIISDKILINHLEHKRPPALKAAEAVKLVVKEKQEIIEKLKLLEYQLLIYQEKFPFLLEYEEEILDEKLNNYESIQTAEEQITQDTVSKYVSKTEYMNLSPKERNQLALDRYLSSHLSKAAIGKLYERYIGYLYEQKGFHVEYHGICKGYEDLGRDLICRRKNEIYIIQAKCWSENKKIHENHICQLFGTAFHYKLNHNLDKCKIKMILVTSTKLSDIAKEMAGILGVDYEENKKLNKSYPLIKCNINKATKEKIYHLPFDQMYDKVVIEPKEGEMYVRTVAEAELHGFRRAFKYKKSH